jgi:mRNA-degrading endonuclease toxin of MazEF toxin-antitoxin module
VLILKKIGNVFAVLPMTSKGADNKFYYRIPDRYFGKPSRVILSQVKVLDKARFIDKIGMLSEGDFNDIKEKLKALLL